MALHLALGLLRPFEGTPIGESLDHLVRRLSADLPRGLREHFDVPVQGLVVRPAAPPSYASSREVLAVVQEALRKTVEVEIEYESADSPLSKRVVAPQALVHAARGLYLVAHDPRAKGERTFRIERIRRASLGKRAVSESAGFDVDAYVGGGVGIFSPEHEPRRVAIRVFSARAARILRENPWHESQVLVRERGAWRLELTLRSTRELVSRVLGFGEEAEVVAPKGLRDEVATRLATAEAKYRDGRNTSSRSTSSPQGRHGVAARGDRGSRG